MKEVKETLASGCFFEKLLLSLRTHDFSSRAHDMLNVVAQYLVPLKWTACCCAGATTPHGRARMWEADGLERKVRHMCVTRLAHCFSGLIASGVANTCCETVSEKALSLMKPARFSQKAHNPARRSKTLREPVKETSHLCRKAHKSARMRKEHCANKLAKLKRR